MVETDAALERSLKRAIYGRKQKREVLAHYCPDAEGPHCMCLGCPIRHIEFLSIEHVGGRGTGAKHRKEIGTVSIYRWLKRNGYPPGFAVLCYNCNLSNGFYGYCPHQRLESCPQDPPVSSPGKSER